MSTTGRRQPGSTLPSPWRSPCSDQPHSADCCWPSPPCSPSPWASAPAATTTPRTPAPVPPRPPRPMAAPRPRPSASATSPTSPTPRRSSAWPGGHLPEALGDTRRSRPRPSTPAPRRSRRSSPRRLDVTYIGPNPAINAFAQSDGEAVRIVVGRHLGRRLPRREARDQRPPRTWRARRSPSPQLGQHPGRRAARLAEGRRASAPTPPAAATSRSSPRTTPTPSTAFKAGADRRRLGARAVGDPPGPGGRRQGPGRRGRPVAGGPVRHHPPASCAPRSSTSTPTWSRPSSRGTVDAIDFINDRPGRGAGGRQRPASRRSPASRSPTRSSPPRGRTSTFTADPIASSLQKSAKDAEAVGLLEPVDLKGIYDLTLLNEVLAERRASRGEGPVTRTVHRAAPATARPAGGSPPDAPPAPLAAVRLDARVQGLRPGRRRRRSRSTASTSTCSPASSSAWSAPRAAARAPCSTSSPASTRPTAGHGRRSTGRTALMFQEAALFPWLTVAGQRRAGAQAARACRRPSARRGSSDAAARRAPRRLRRQAAARAVRRHAPARGARPGASPRTPTSCSWTSPSARSTR